MDGLRDMRRMLKAEKSQHFGSHHPPASHHAMSLSPNFAHTKSAASKTVAAPRLKEVMRMRKLQEEANQRMLEMTELEAMSRRSNTHVEEAFAKIKKQSYCACDPCAH